VGKIDLRISSRFQRYIEALTVTTYMVGFGIIACGLMLNVTFEGPFTQKRAGVVYVAKDSAAAQRGYALPGEGHAANQAIDPRQEMAKIAMIIGGVLSALGFVSTLLFIKAKGEWGTFLGCMPIMGGMAGGVVGMFLGFVPNAAVYWMLLGLISGAILVIVPIRLAMSRKKKIGESL
jgi:hypothetical protein